MDFLPPDFHWPEFIFTLVIGDLILTVISVLFADRLKTCWREYWHGGWEVHISGGPLPEPVISAVRPEKQMEIKDDPADRDVYLKGRISPYKWLSCPVDEVLTTDKAGKKYLIDLDKDRDRAPMPWSIVSRAGGEEVTWMTIAGKKIIVDLERLPWPPAGDDGGGQEKGRP